VKITKNETKKGVDIFTGCGNIKNEVKFQLPKKKKKFFHFSFSFGQWNNICEIAVYLHFLVFFF
jgi:hypothetical protein